MFVVIMAGGRGTRFWPLSRAKRPKQLLPIFGDRPMITETIERFESVVPPSRILVVTSEQLADAVAEAVPQLPPENILREPFGRNTAPCIGLAAMSIRERTGREDEVMAVFPADHFIRDVERFRERVELAVDEASGGGIVTFGIEPTAPETGYGYIRHGEMNDRGVADVEAFVEKPNREKALAYLADGRYLWNSGMFFFRVDTILFEVRRQLPSLALHLTALADVVNEPEGWDHVCNIYERIRPVSIDYGVMENAQSVRVVRGDFGWSDVGHWDALPDVSETDEQGNVAIGDVVAIDCHDSVLIGHDRRVLAAVGLHRIVVVDTEDALLVAPRERVQEVRRVVEQLKSRDPDLT